MKYIIVGATGYLGHSIFSALVKTNHDLVYGTGHNNCIPGIISLDLAAKSDMQKIVSLKPDVVIWCACDYEKEILHTHAGLAECIDTLPDTTRLLYCSTMIGKGKNQSETISPSVRLDGDYLKEYFNGKIEGERIVQKHANHVIIRPGSIYGYDCDGNLDKRMKKLLEQASNGLTYKRTANMYTSFIHISDLTNAILELSENDFKGILNISCENPVSYYEFNRHLAGLLKIDKNVVVADYKPDELYNTFSNTLRKTVLKSPIREIE